MIKMSKDKRDKFILVCIGVIAVVGVLYTFVLGAQKNKLATLESQISGMRNKLQKAENTMRTALVIESNLAASKKVIDVRQENMAPQGQYYYWFLKLVDQFRKDVRLDAGFVVDITQPEFIDAGLLPKFPYKAASFGLRVNGHYEEIGRFVADIENAYPYFRVQNLRVLPQIAEIVPAASKQGASRDGKLIAELRVVTLVKPGGTI